MTTATEKTQLKTLLGFKQMEKQMDKLEETTKQLQKEKELEAIKLKEQALQEAKMKQDLDNTARAAIKARRLENKLV